MIALDSIEIVDKDLINVSWFENGNHWQTWDSNDLFNHIIDLNDEIERLNNIIEEAIKGIEDYYYGDKEYKEYDYTLAYQIYHILKGEDKK